MERETIGSVAMDLYCESRKYVEILQQVRNILKRHKGGFICVFLNELNVDRNFRIGVETERLKSWIHVQMNQSYTLQEYLSIKLEVDFRDVDWAIGMTCFDLRVMWLGNMIREIILNREWENNKSVLSDLVDRVWSKRKLHLQETDMNLQLESSKYIGILQDIRTMLQRDKNRFICILLNDLNTDLDFRIGPEVDHLKFWIRNQMGNVFTLQQYLMYKLEMNVEDVEDMIGMECFDLRMLWLHEMIREMILNRNWDCNHSLLSNLVDNIVNARRVVKSIRQTT